MSILTMINLEHNTPKSAGSNVSTLGDICGNFSKGLDTKGSTDNAAGGVYPTIQVPGHYILRLKSKREVC
jgi:hypothetical protein